MSTVQRAAAACAQSLQSLLTLGEQLTEPEWSAATACTEWSVADVYAHVLAVEAWLAAGGIPFEVPTQQWIDEPVAAHRGMAPGALLTELRELLPVRLEQLSAAADQPTVFIPFLHAEGPAELGLMVRAFDLWTHEQDIRLVVARPGGLDARGARITRDLLLLNLPKGVAKIAGAPPGSTVRLTTLGEVLIDVAVHVDDSGRGALCSPREADAHLTMSWETFARLSAGRGTASDYEVWIGGDGELAQRVLAGLNIAP